MTILETLEGLAEELGRRDRSYARAAVTAYSTTGARESMIRMARDVLGVAHDPEDAVVDLLADAYWRGVGRADRIADVEREAA